VQYYKLLRLGKEGYRNKVDYQMKVAAFLRKELSEMKRPDGKPRFEILDTGDSLCLPFVGARLNNTDGRLTYDDIDFQHALAQR
jgi:glutamate/tyrosine decarboxylase-like PLP-dependent enzyme